MSPEERRRRLILALARTQLAYEELHLEVADAIDDGLTLRPIAHMLGVGPNVVKRWKDKGYAARDYRSGGPADASGERGQVGGGTGEGSRGWTEPVLPFPDH
jgi:hypothetical protein